MCLVVWVINVIVRILLAWGMFNAYHSGHLLLAGVCLVGVMKRDWLSVYIDNNRRKR